MLQIKNLTALHSKDSHLLFKDFSFVLNDGDKAAVIGEEGNGKSTLLKLIYDPALVKDYIEYSGEIVRGNSVTGYFAQELSQKEKEQSVMDFCFSAPGFGELSPAELSGLCSGMGMINIAGIGTNDDFPHIMQQCCNLQVIFLLIQSNHIHNLSFLAVRSV